MILHLDLNTVIYRLIVKDVYLCGDHVTPQLSMVLHLITYDKLQNSVNHSNFEEI